MGHAQLTQQCSSYMSADLVLCQHALQSGIVLSLLLLSMTMLKLESLDLLHSSLVLCLQQATCQLENSE